MTREMSLFGDDKPAQELPSLERLNHAPWMRLVGMNMVRSLNPPVKQSQRPQVESAID